MKYIKLIVFLALSIVSCQYQEIIPDKLADFNAEDVDYYSIIESMGYPIEDIVEYEDFFVVSGETFFYKDDLSGYSITHPQTKINALGTLPTNLQTIYINDQFIDAAYVSLLEQAIEHWNNLEDCNLNFIYPHEVCANCVVLEISDTPTKLTQSNAMIRESVMEGTIPTVSINTSHNTWLSLSGDQQVYAIMHAIGHLIGLKDSDETEYYIDKTSNEPYSTIMRPADEITPADYFSYWNGFGYGDIEALAKMYPLLVTSVSISADSQTLYSGYPYSLICSYEARKDIPNVNYKFSVISMPESASNPIVSADGNKCVVEFNVPGIYTIKAEVLGGDDQTIRGTYTKTLLVVGLNRFIYPKITEVRINTPFEIIWDKYVDGKKADVTMTGIESCFDGGNSSNLEISNPSIGQFNVILKEYGSYTLTMEARLEEFVERKVIQIDKFYKPLRMVMDSLNINLEEDIDYRQEPFIIGDYCQKVDTTDTTNTTNHICARTPYSTKLSQSGTLEGRLFCKVYKKYYKESFPVAARAVQRRPITDTTFVRTVIRYPGDDVTYTPDFDLHDIEVYYTSPVYSDYGPVMYERYRGYYGIVVPESRIYIQE